jgi:hypothetical protein
MDDGLLEFLTPAELADVLRITDRALEMWRRQGRGPQFIRLGPTRIIYRRSAVEAWLLSKQEPKTVLPTAA